MFFLSFVLFLYNVVSSARRGVVAGPNPWDAGTLEWAAASPPLPQNFDRIPVVTHREPLWAERHSLPVVAGLSVENRELIISTVTAAQADLREASPEPSLWPFIAAVVVSITFIGLIFTPWAVVWGGFPIALALIGWFWPKSSMEDTR
jgi:cytochrome c oxidase subunit 1